MNNKLLALIYLITITVCAQNDSLNKSVIRISEKDLSSIVSRIVEAKHKKLDAQKNLLNDTLTAIKTHETLSDNLEIDYLNQELAQLKRQLNNTNSVKSRPIISADKKLYLRNEIEDLQKKIDKMNRLIREQNNNPSSKIIVEHKSEIQKSPDKINAVKVNEIKRQNHLVKSDSIKTTLNKIPVSESPRINYNDSLITIKKKIVALQNEMAVNKTAPSDYTLLSKKYNSYKRELYFENNSKSIDTAQAEKLNELVTILKENENIDVLIKGFASKKGSAIYNQNLSMQRAETIKISLIEKGVPPIRVLTVYHGIDYEAATDEKARRVDISLIIRK